MNILHAMMESSKPLLLHREETPLIESVFA